MYVNGVNMLLFVQFSICCCGLKELDKLIENFQLIDKDMEAQTQKTEFDNVALSEEEMICL